ncbi:MAG: hypothetical protein ACRC1D_10115 [Culicoidibacterales bacterium]
MKKQIKNLLRTGSWQRAVCFFAITLGVATVLLPTLMYVLVRFFTTFDPNILQTITWTNVTEFAQSKTEFSGFMLVSYALISLLYWAIYMNALIRARMLRNRGGRPEVAGNQEYGSSVFLEITDLAQRYHEFEEPIKPKWFQKKGKKQV